MIKKAIPHIKLFTKYAIVGGTATLVDLGGLYIFVGIIGLNVIPGAICSFIIASGTSFILNKIWTFQHKSKNYRRLYIKFLSVSLVGLGLTIIFMHLFVNLFGIWYMLAKIMTSSIVVFWNFLANKLWTFRVDERKLNIFEECPFFISIIIPAYNEENRIKKTLLAVADYLKSKNINSEIIVVSDGSTDKTKEVVKNFSKKIKNLRLIAYEKNQGKGYAVKIGVEKSRGEYILFTDADNSTPIEEMGKLLKKIKEKAAQIAIGSRYLEDSNVKIKQSWFRIFIGRAGNILIRFFLIDGVKDTQCGFKIFEHRTAKKIFALQKVKRFGFDMEALVIAKNLGYKIIEVPISWINSPDSRVHPIKDTIATLKDLLYIKLNLWTGRYSEKDL